MLIKILLSVYIIIVIDSYMHETGHIIAARFFECKINEVVLGSKSVSFSIGRVYFSPVVLGTYIDIDEMEIDKLSIYQLIVFYISGVCSSSILLIASVMNLFGAYSEGFVYVCSISVICSILPILPQNDMNQLLKQLRKRSRRI